jgi:excisionase family DNA binding protein
MKREPQQPFEALIRSREAAKLLGVSEWLLRKLAHQGELAYVHLGATCPMLFDPADLRRWVEKQKIRNGNGNNY